MIRRLKRYQHSPFFLRCEAGFTLMELLIVVAIIAILAAIMFLVNWRTQIYRANDARRKSDLAEIRRAFEEYYNDHECYPSPDVLKTCGGTDLAPGLRKIPCDPVTGDPYKYEPADGANICMGYRVCAKLMDFSDPDISTLGCHPKNGCGWGMFWNYCLATGTTVVAAGFNPNLEPTPTPLATPTPTPTPSYNGHYACVPGGPGCNAYDDPAKHGCPASWTECHLDLCANPANRCTD